MGTYRIYTGEDGHSHIEEIEIGGDLLPMTDLGPDHRPVTDVIAARGLHLHRTAPPYYNAFHLQPVRRFIVVLEGQIEIGVKDGTSRRFNPGDVTLREDMTGSGHYSRVTSATPAVTAVVDLDD
jgi:hypothetical protein